MEPRELLVATVRISFFQIESSHTSHAFLDDILAVGSYNPQHNKAEVLNTDRNTWSQIKDYPYDWG